MYLYYSKLIIQHIYALQPKRFGSKGSGQVGMEGVSFAALSLLIGNKDVARKIILLLIDSYRKNEILYREYPIYCFLLRLFADYFCMPVVPFSDKVKDEVLFQHLFDKWKNPEFDRLKELCVLVCDYHLTRCKPSKGNDWYEFSNLSWSLWPIEINLLFKLRELLGLNNPDINHPLMNTTLGQLPAEKEFVLDDLLLQVLERMRSQGFDENEVFERIYSEKF